MKTCTKCKAEKPLDQFQKDSHKPDGLRPACKECANAALRDYRHRNPEKIKAQKKEYWDRHGEKYAPRRKEYYEKNKERETAMALKYYRENRDKCRELSRQWKKDNPEKRKDYREEHRAELLESGAKRRALKHNAMPSWANRKYIKLFYQMAREEAERTGKPVHVDHIIPVVSDFVCGLHCEDNLQLMFAGPNLSKGNRWWPDMWDPE